MAAGDFRCNEKTRNVYQTFLDIPAELGWNLAFYSPGSLRRQTVNIRGVSYMLVLSSASLEDSMYWVEDNIKCKHMLLFVQNKYKRLGWIDMADN